MSVISDLPQITVGIPIHGGTLEEDINSCIESVLDQDYESFSILVLSEDEDMSDDLRSRFTSSIIDIIDIENEDGGLSYARNEIYKRSNADVITYIDADAEADENWLSEIGQTYRDKEVPAVGGKAEPVWDSKRPILLPEEFFWLVGVTDANHPDHGSTIRNAFGCNMSYKRDILEKLGGFNTDLGKNKSYNLQGEEPELGERLMNEMNLGVYYNENAGVNHKVSDNQATLRWLSKRAYLQGVSKAVIKSTTSSSLSREKQYLHEVLGSCIKYAKRSLAGPKRLHSFFSIFTVLYFTALVGIGYGVMRIKGG